MADGQSESLIIGNGDLYGIVWADDGGLQLRITKNDIWDARVDTSKDGPLPKVNVRTRAVSGSTGAPPSYANAYPQPLCAATIRIAGTSPVAQGVLDLQHAVATLTAGNGDKTSVRVLADRNVILIDTKEVLSIKVGHGGQFGTTDGVNWEKVVLPADVDYQGMEYCVAVAGTPNTKVVALVTSFDITTRSVLDAAIALDDWGKLDEVIAKFPRADFPALLEWMPKPDGRYRLAHWWYCLFERHWSLRGMTNALTDYYEYPEETHRLFQALTDFYGGIITRCAREAPFDGLWTSDDLGTQGNGFFSPGIFREFFKPYYRQIFDTCHRLRIHNWMHACGCVREFIPDWIASGLDVLHPIQKHTMDERAIAKEFGGRLTIFTGLDVQRVIPWGTPDEVRAEVRHLMDTFWRPGEGRCMITAGNGINGDCTLAGLEAFLDESFRYGAVRVTKT